MEVGQKIDHYTLEDKVGDGGFGDVFRAVDDNTGMEVAIKCSRPQESSRIQDFEQRFLREVACISKLRHPGIVQLFDYGALPDKTFYLVMEYVCGLNLDVLIKRDAPYSYVFASNIILQILDALSEAHSQGIVHRDLKPANIMLVQRGLRRDIVKLLDFGIAKAFDGTEPDLTRQTFDKGVGFGSPQYMPPEQFYGQKAGPYSDLYAVGLLFLELLTGKPAITGKTLSEIVEKQIRTFPTIEPPFNQGPLFDVFRRALAKQPSMRYQTALEMYCDVDAIVRQQSPYLPIYASAAGKQSPQLTVSLQRSEAAKKDVDDSEFDVEDQDSTVDTMMFDNQTPTIDDDNVDLSNFNTMIFESDVSPAAPAPRSLYKEIEQMVETAPTDDMSRLSPTVPSATNKLPQSQILGCPPRPSTVTSRLGGSMPKTDQFDCMASSELNIATHAMPAHPELAYMSRADGPVSIASDGYGEDIEESRTRMLEPEGLPPISDDLSPVFHQQKTQFIPKHISGARRPTGYNDGLMDRIITRMMSTSFGIKFFNSAPVLALTRAQKHLSRYIDSLYEEHFLALVIGVCTILILLTVILVWLVLI